MKDQIKKEAKELLHQLDKNLDELQHSSTHAHSFNLHESSKDILKQLDNKLSSLSGVIAGWKYDVFNAFLKGANEEVDVALASSDTYKMGELKHSLHKGLNTAARLLIDLV